MLFGRQASETMCELSVGEQLDQRKIERLCQTVHFILSGVERRHITKNYHDATLRVYVLVEYKTLYILHRLFNPHSIVADDSLGTGFETQPPFKRKINTL